MNFKFDQIIKILETLGCSYSVIDPNNISHNNFTYQLSSIKNKIKGGLYYLAEEYIDESNLIFDSLILIDNSLPTNNSNIYLRVDNPQLVHYKIALTLEKKIKSGIHATAIIDEDAIIDPTAYIGPYCIIGKCEIGANVSLLGHVTVTDNVLIKANTIIEGNSLIGARGMSWIWDENGQRIIQPQLGGVIIESDCILGSDISIVRGSLSENTKIGKGTIIAHGTKIGHGCQVGEYVHFANNVSLAGNAQISDRVFLGSGCVVSPNVKIGKGCIVGAGAVVNKSITEEYSTIAGVPAKVIKQNNFEYKPKGAPKPYKI